MSSGKGRKRKAKLRRYIATLAARRLAERQQQRLREAKQKTA
jgi:hypothetical protein